MYTWHILGRYSSPRPMVGHQVHAQARHTEMASVLPWIMHAQRLCGPHQPRVHQSRVEWETLGPMVGVLRCPWWCVAGRTLRQFQTTHAQRLYGLSEVQAHHQARQDSTPATLVGRRACSPVSSCVCMHRHKVEVPATESTVVPHH